MIHDLKTLPQYYDAVVAKSKTFELRKNDRGFAVGDFLNLQRLPEMTETHLVEVTYVLEGGIYGLDPEYCILGIK